MMLLEAACVPLLVFTAAQGEDVVHATAHYELRLAGGPEALEEAAAAGVVLEAAREQLEEFFRARPKTKGDERVSVFLARDRETWLARIRAAGVEPPSAADLVHYAPEQDTIFVYSDGTRAQRRTLLLHGAVQQFHCKCKAKNRDLVRSWLAMGLADHLSLHVWDGSELRLGAQPVVANDDVLGRARELLDPNTLDPGLLFEQGLQRGEICMAMTRFLLDHAGTKRRKQFEKLVLGYRGSKLLPSTYAKVLGDPARVAGELLQWLDREPQPMRVEAGSWQDDGAAGIRARSGGREARAVFKLSPQELTVRLAADASTGAAAGIELGGVELDARWRVSVLPGEILVRGVTSDGSSYERALPLSGRPDRTVELALRRDGADVLLFADREPIGVHALETPLVGLFVEGGDRLFEGLSWR